MKKLHLALVLVSAFLMSPGLQAEEGQVDLGAADFKMESTLVELSAKVTAIDAENRHVTLEGPQGNSVTIAVDPAVKNFKKIKKGDMVLVKYYESLAWELKKPGEKQAMTKTETQETTTAAAGEKPAREETRTVDLIATIEAIDKETPSVTLKGPEGNSRTIKVKNPKNLKGVKVGDQVAVTYTESLAVSVEKAPKQ